MNPLDTLDHAGRHFLDQVDLVGSDDWDRPSVCDGWSVRDVVLHVVGGCRMAVALLGGASREAGLLAKTSAVDGPLMLATIEAVELQRAAFAHGALDGVVHHPVFDMTGRQLLDQRIVELTVHGWDLDRSLGGAGLIDDGLAAASWAVMEPLATITAQIGVYGDGPSGQLGDAASAAQRLIDVTGRRP